MNGDDQPTLPPLRLPPEAELARAALASPLLVRAVALARWAKGGIRVGAGGELLGDQLLSAAEHLGLEGEDARALAAEAWNIAVDIDLVEVVEDETADDEGPMPDADEAVALATPGEELEAFDTSGPSDVLAVWEGVFGVMVGDAAMPNMEDLLEELTGGEGGFDPQNPDGAELDWDPQAEADLLDSALANLYVLTASENLTGEDPAPPIPLPVLASSLAVPEDVEEPTEEMLAEVSAVMMRLDDQFRILEPTGAVEYRPIDEELLVEAGEEDWAESADPDGPDGEEDVSRYGVVRLTPLGQYGVRQLMEDEGVHAPLVGELTELEAPELFAEIAGHYPESAALAELNEWIAVREPLAAVRELLAAARGEDGLAPWRRLLCQQILAAAGQEVEPALREVLEDGQLGGLARVWLAEHGADDVPPPSEDMVFWLTVDTFAAQLVGELTEEQSQEVQELMRGLVDQHSGFFERVWRVSHPATAEVLEAMGRLHPDRQAAKEARKAAHRARSLG
ncbi:hypothetical protein MTQ01_10860 [Streptomyces sp. XM4193]|uniref:hypothetical protein n=1 Tax=Streptomyces sp. XM4193 TaxID=2929782 RepID=UPI001FFB1B31|nr:hypothetical protein [Streptomyces sp. XM4193]MCK1796500.1 hypothetical protein [Streptomyces sp. XM4193]